MQGTFTGHPSILESAIIFAKILLPQIFEEMAMQDLRALVSERSRINIHLRGEIIEIPNHSIGFLLEGLVRAHGFQEELITSPAALLPPHGNQSLEMHMETEALKVKKQVVLMQPVSLIKDPGIKFETRARVIIFVIAASEADSALLRRLSSLVPYTGDHPHRPLSREHGLMSWPENFYKAKLHKQNLENERANSLPAKAMQLSIFGSMVEQEWCAHRPSSSLVKRSRSMPFSRAASHQGHPLVSVRSEGSTTLRKNLQGVNAFINAFIDVPAPPLKRTDTNESRALHDSSDESGTEDNQVMIDSPRRHTE